MHLQQLHTLWNASPLKYFKEKRFGGQGNVKRLTITPTLDLVKAHYLI